MKQKTNRENTLRKNIFVLTALLLASQMGAGYASGREIVGFFGNYGWFNIILTLVLFLGYALILNSYGNIAKNIKAKNVTDVTKKVFGKLSPVANFFLFFSMFASLSVTIAGLDNITSNFVSNYNFPFVSIVICIVVIAIITGGLRAVLKASSLIVPIMISIMFLTIFYFLIFGTHGNVDLQAPSASVMGVGILSSLLYVGSNLNSSGTMLTQVSDKFDKKNIKWSSFFFAFFFAFGVGITISTLYKSSNAIFNSDMPMPNLAQNIHSILGVAYYLILFMAMAMTLTAVSFSLTHWFKKYFPSTLATVVTIIILGFVVSRVGFGAIIDYVYPIKGAGGLVVGLGVYIYHLKHKTKKPKQN